MHMPLCSRCHKNVAVVFISKMEEGSTSNEGYCLKCAKELGLKPIDGLMRQMGITEDDLDQITDEMTNMHSLMNTEDDDAEDAEIDPDEDDADGSRSSIRCFPATTTRKHRARNPARMSARMTRAARKKRQKSAKICLHTAPI